MEENLFDLNDYEESTQTIKKEPDPQTSDTTTTNAIKAPLINLSSFNEQTNASTIDKAPPEDKSSKGAIKAEEASAKPNGKQAEEIQPNASLVQEANASISSSDSLLTEKSQLTLKVNAIEDEIDVAKYSLITSFALTYPFELDDFQKRSIIRLEQHQNVLACAHTSSGKTVIAEYGIALGKRNKRRVLYTSPIKALSNQKYRDFKKKFGDVGILTGDVSINPDAQCLVMTTEILQNSLYKNSELLNSVEWVVFDEVHYINDNERGHVWEEILILLPSQIGIIMLSATVPNYMEFAKWVGRIKNTTIYVQNTLKRIVPLEHNLFIDEYQYFLAKDSNKVYEKNIQNALYAIHSKSAKEKYLLQSNWKFSNDRKQKEGEFYYNIKWFDQFRKAPKQSSYGNSRGDRHSKKDKDGKGQGTKPQGGKPNFLRITNIHFKIEEIVKFLCKYEYTPAVIFVFSIKRILEYAKMLSTFQLVDNNQSKRITSFFDTCIRTLDETDQEIPQIIECRYLLQNGIGMHHAGLLPILKEIIEVLYSRGLIKVLFATTSFSIGLNMPTRTVVFTDIYKFNEERKEILSSSEYLQMCGRAGRRGIDKTGNVFLLLTEKNGEKDESDITSMLKGTGTEVESKFRLCYRTIISFFSRNIKNINQFFKESFLENMNLEQVPVIMKEIEETKRQLKDTPTIDCLEIQGDGLMKEHMAVYNDLLQINLQCFDNPAFLCKLKPGRFIRVRDTEYHRDLTVMVVYHYVKFNGEIWCVRAFKDKPQVKYEADYYNSSSSLKGIFQGIKFEYVIYSLEDIIDIFNSKFQISPVLENSQSFHFLSNQELIAVIKKLNYLNKTSSSDLKPYSYLHMVQNELEISESFKRREELIGSLKETKCSNCPLLSKHFDLNAKRSKLTDDLAEKEKFLNPENLNHYNEFNTRLSILKELGYIDSNNLITLKGKAAREIATTDCVMISELLLSNILEGLKEDELIAFLSGFAFNKNEIELVDPKISPKFTECFDEFQKIYDNLVKVEASNNFEDNKYNRRMTFAVSKAMQSWMLGNKFIDILRETDLEEGKLYNLIMRIYLFLEEIINFYGVIGNISFSQKYGEIKKKLMRGIMSTQSLYLQEEINIDIEQEK